MKLLIMGPAGSGKGTMSEKIVADYGVVHLSTGDMLRAGVSNETDFGLKAKKYMDAGQLVPDEIVNGIIKERLQGSDIKEKGFLFDGYPRTLAQAEALTEMLEELNMTLDCVINLNVEFDKLADRITGRRTCEKCKTIYHIETKKPKVDGICDLDGGKLIQRDDDTEQGLKVRLDEYEKNTQPVIKYYRDSYNVKDINASQAIDDVYKDIKEALELI